MTGMTGTRGTGSRTSAALLDFPGPDPADPGPDPLIQGILGLGDSLRFPATATAVRPLHPDLPIRRLPVPAGPPPRAVCRRSRMMTLIALAISTAYLYSPR